MRYAKKRHIEPRYYDSNSTKGRQIASHRVKRCGVCTYLIPEEDMIVEDGIEKCPMCADTYTAEYLAAEEAHVALVKKESAYGLAVPPQFSTRNLTEARAAAVTSITDVNGNTVSQSSQLRMIRNVAATLILNGQYFTNAITFTYPTGLSDSVAPVITSTKITLSLIAAIGMAPGSYSITLNDGISQNGHVYANLLAVR